MDDLFCETREGVVVVKDHTTILELVQLGIVVNESLDINTFGGRVHLIKGRVLFQLGDEVDIARRVEFLVEFSHSFGEVGLAAARRSSDVEDLTLLGIGGRKDAQLGIVGEVNTLVGGVVVEDAFVECLAQSRLTDQLIGFQSLVSCFGETIEKLDAVSGFDFTEFGRILGGLDLAFGTTTALLVVLVEIEHTAVFLTAFYHCERLRTLILIKREGRHLVLYDIILQKSTHSSVISS